MLEGTRRGAPLKWTHDKCMAALRQYDEWCTDNKLRPTRFGYYQWSSERTDVPSVGTIDRLGPWNTVRLALEGYSPEWSQHNVHWLKEECSGAVVRFLEHCQELHIRPSIKTYEKWRIDKVEPSYRTIILLYKTWNQAISENTTGNLEGSSD
jgi:hypothetical protein